MSTYTRRGRRLSGLDSRCGRGAGCWIPTARRDGWCVQVSFGMSHDHRNGSKRFGIVIARIPEEEAVTAVFVGRANLRKDVLGGIRSRLPREGLQPRTQCHAGTSGNPLEAVHGGGDEMRRLVAWVRVTIHAEEMRRINQGREHHTVLRHLRDVLTGMVQIDLTLPRQTAKDVEREQNARGMQFAVSLIEEAGDYVIAMNFGV